MYTPDYWTIVKIDSPEDPHYRVFASWTGGFTNADPWRLNSGIVRVEFDGSFYDFYGATGSVYRCHKDSYGANSYGRQIMESYVKQDPVVFKILPEENDWLTMDWIISE